MKSLRYTRNQILLIIGGALVAIVACIAITALLVGQLNLSASGTAAVAPVNTPSPSDSSSSSASPATSESDSQCASQVHYYTTDDGVRRPNDFGPPVEQTRSAVLKAFKSRQCDGDPMFTSATTGFLQDDYSAFDGRTASYISSRSTWRTDASDNLDKLKSMDLSWDMAPAGSWTLCTYQKLDQTYAIRSCKTAERTTVAVFTDGNGNIYEFALDCGLQPLRENEFYGVPEAPKPVEMPQPTPSKSLESKHASEDANAQGHADQGGGKNEDPGPGTYVPPSEAPKPSSTPRTNPPPPSSSSSSDSSSSSSGSSSGSGSGSSSSDPSRSVPPPEQGAPDPSDAPSTCSAPPGGSC